MRDSRISDDEKEPEYSCPLVPPPNNAWRATPGGHTDPNDRGGGSNTWLGLEKVPYAFSILVAIFAWTVVQFTNELKDSPVLEYSCSGYNAKDKTTSYTLENISSGTLFSDLTVRIHFDPPLKLTKISRSRIQVVNGRMALSQPRELDIVKKGTEFGEYTSFRIPFLHPGVCIKITAITDEKPNTKLFVESRQAAKLMESGLQTKVMKNRFWILLGLTCLWLAGILAYMVWFYNRRQAKPSKEA